jgi:hypothetical protein
MDRHSRILFAMTLATLMLAACTTPAPTPRPNAVVHFRNLSGSALFVSITSGDLEIQGFVRPCGGEAEYAVPDPSGDDPRVGLGALYDQTGFFDHLIEGIPHGTDRLEDIDTSVTFSAIIWSTGDIGIEDMPIWVTFHAGTTDVSHSAFTATTPPRCDPWPQSE